MIQVEVVVVNDNTFAERVGFEPTVPIKERRFSKPLP